MGVSTSMCEVVGEDHVSNLVLLDMHLFKGIEKIAWDGIAKTVLEDNDPTTVVHTCVHLGDLGVATHECIVGTTVIGLEERTFGRRLFTYHFTFGKLELDIGRCVFAVFRGIIIEVLRGLAHHRLARKGRHGAHKVRDLMFLVVRKVLKRDACHLTKLLGRIIGATGSPMVVGA